MNTPFPSRGFVILAILLGGLAGVAPRVVAQSARAIQFNRDVRPILSANCWSCHGPDAAHREADLRLDTREGAVARRDGQAAIVPGQPEQSHLLLRALRDDPDERMPPADSGKSLTPAQIDTLRRWIAEGAVYQRHWAFEPENPAPPPLVDASAPARDPAGAREDAGADEGAGADLADWPRGGVDLFVLARLRQEGWTPSPEADRVTLLRRLSLDLLGLPPTPEQADAFAADDRPDAVERLVDELLASPRFGERWGRHWLDEARYADSHGYTNDDARVMWPWRDWVLAAFNSDMPFDQFTREQLAGDLLPKATRAQVTATGFHRNTLINTEGGVKADQFRVEQVKDRVDTTGLVWLGLTVACAQCHSHKFDPIQQSEYYGLLAFFDSTADQNSTAPTLSLPSPEQEAELARLDAGLAAAKREVEAQKRAAALEADLAEAAKVQAAWETRRAALVKNIPTVMVLRELPKPRTTHVHLRGDFLRPGAEVAPHVPAVLPGLPEPLGWPETPGLPGTSGRPTRLDLARWLARPDHPLTARVRVNRIWMRLFGRGLVETDGDFGAQGAAPSHPELLDWLALEFKRRDWSTKELLRLIVTSAAYRQASRARPDLDKHDPGNALLARQARFRVEAEIVRDAALAAGGLLSSKIGGPSVYPPQPDGVYDFTQVKKGWPTSPGEDRYRRGMYTFFYRSAPHPLFTTFDTPKFNSSCTRRDRSNTALQALTAANDETVLEACRALVERAGREVADNPGDADARLRRLFRLCLTRAPTDSELARLRAFANAQRGRYASDPAAAREVLGAPASTGPVIGENAALRENAALPENAALVAAARVLLNLDEFITRE